MYVSAKEFCEETGFPSRTLIRYLREGKIDSHRAGRRYVIDREQAIERLRALAHEKTFAPVDRRNHKSRYSKKKDSSHIFDGVDDYQERISLLKKTASSRI